VISFECEGCIAKVKVLGEEIVSRVNEHNQLLAFFRGLDIIYADEVEYNSTDNSVCGHVIQMMTEVQMFILVNSKSCLGFCPLFSHNTVHS